MGWRGAAALVQRDVACRVHDLLQVPSWCSARNLLWSAIGQRAVCAPGRNAVVAAVCACVRARTRTKNACARAALVCVHVRVCACFDGALGGGDTVAEVVQLHVVCRVQHLTTGKPMQSRRHGRPHVANVARCQCCVLSDTCAVSVACTAVHHPSAGEA